jgi:hypothetical protein
MAKPLIVIILFALIACSCVAKDGLPECRAEDITLPTSLHPNLADTVVTSRPTFSWTFTPSSACWPRSFFVRLGDYPTLDLHSFGLDFVGTNLGGTTLTPAYDILEDCRTYYWILGINVFPVGYAYSHIASFQTDFSGGCTSMEECTIEDAPPTPYAFRPLDGAGIDTLNPELIWQPHSLTCDPMEYYYEVSDSPEFTTKVIEGMTTDTIHEETTNYLEDCSTYYWRVTAMNGSLTATSRINQFWTYAAGACFTKPDCTASQLVADTPVYPSAEEIVTDPRPYLVWESHMSACLPEITAVLISKKRDLSDFLLRASYDPTTRPHMDHTIYSSPDELYEDCTRYYWGTREIADGESVWSEVNSFYTNFSGRCMIAVPPVSDVIRRVRFDCINPNLTVLLFSISNPIQGTYQAQIGNNIWPCEFQETGNDQLLVCAGPWTKENVKTQVYLIETSSGTQVYSSEVTTPICEVLNPISCQEPAGGCNPICHWDSAQCACLNPNHGPCQ